MPVCYSADLVYVDGQLTEGVFFQVEDGTITSVGPKPSGNVPVQHFSGAAVIPGAVNTHTHSFQSLLRGRMDGLRIPEWLAGVYAASADYGPTECYLGAAVSFGEMLRAGTTTVADFFYLNAHGNDNVRAAIQAAKDVGIRLDMGRACLDAEWSGRGVRETAEVAASRFTELADEFAQDDLVTISPAPHSLHGASQPMIQAMHQLAVDHDTVWYCHLGYEEDHANEVESMFGKRSLEVLDEWGVLDDRLVIAHGLWFSDRELDLIVSSGARVSYNPASNMFLGEVVLDLSQLWSRGITVGLATDGAASNNLLSVFGDARLASLCQKLRARDPAVVTSGQIFALATEDGARALRTSVGSIGVGKKADFAVLDLADLSLVPHSGLESHLVHALSERAIAEVWVHGRKVVENGRLLGVDGSDIARRASQIASV